MDRELADEAPPQVVREVQIEAPPERVWEALVTEEGRERWLDDAPDVEIETFEPHHHVAWRWSAGDGECTRVDFRIVAVPDGSRVVVTETTPTPHAPIAALAASFALVAA